MLIHGRQITMHFPAKYGFILWRSFIRNENTSIGSIELSSDIFDGESETYQTKIVSMERQCASSDDRRFKVSVICWIEGQ